MYNLSYLRSVQINKMDYICKQLKSPALLSKTLTKKTNDKSVSDLGLKNRYKEQSETRNNLGIG